MSIRSAAGFLIVLSQLSLAAGLANAQGQRFKIGGGAGFANLRNPDIEHGSTAALGGFFGIRFNDNLSLESTFAFARSNRVFNADNVPVDQTRDTPSFRFETNRYHLDASFMYNIGRRQPFHPFIFGGVGLVRRDEKQTDFTFERDPDTNQDVLTSSDVAFDRTDYEPAGHFGIGAEIYFFHNLAARAEFKVWLPRSIELRTRQFFFSASYYF